MTEDPLLTEKEAARWLKVSTKTLQRLRERGKVNYSRLGDARLVRYTYDDLRLLLNATSPRTSS